MHTFSRRLVRIQFQVFHLEQVGRDDVISLVKHNVVHLEADSAEAQLLLCLCSSVVEQGFCKAQVASSNLVEGFCVSHIHSYEWGISSEAERQFPVLDVIGSIPLFSTNLCSVA